MGMASILTEPLEIVAARDALQIEIFGLTRFPQALLRIGWAPIGADPLPATSRRKLHEVATKIDGSPLPSA